VGLALVFRGVGEGGDHGAAGHFFDPATVGFDRWIINQGRISGMTIDDRANRAMACLPEQGVGHGGVVERAEVWPSDDEGGVVDGLDEVDDRELVVVRIERHEDAADAFDQQDVAGLVEQFQGMSQGREIDGLLLRLGSHGWSERRSKGQGRDDAQRMGGVGKMCKREGVLADEAFTLFGAA